MKNTNWAEKIGFVLIIIGFIFALLDGNWENNPIPSITKNSMFINSVGLLTWALGRMKRQAKEKKVD